MHLRLLFLSYNDENAHLMKLEVEFPKGMWRVSIAKLSSLRNTNVVILCNLVSVMQNSQINTCPNGKVLSHLCCGCLINFDSILSLICKHVVFLNKSIFDHAILCANMLS